MFHMLGSFFKAIGAVLLWILELFWEFVEFLKGVFVQTWENVQNGMPLMDAFIGELFADGFPVNEVFVYDSLRFWDHFWTLLLIGFGVCCLTEENKNIANLNQDAYLKSFAAKTNWFLFLTFIFFIFDKDIYPLAIFPATLLFILLSTSILSKIFKKICMTP